VNERNAVPIITMNDQPIWVVGYRIDDRVKITEATKTFLVIRFEKQDINKTIFPSHR
jgi:hypothetical protein